MACDVRWRVTYAADFETAQQITFDDGELILRRDALHIVLLNTRGGTVDARFHREGEFIDIGGVVSFPCHFASNHADYFHYVVEKVIYFFWEEEKQ